MAADKKFVAVLVLCMVVLSALAIPKAEANPDYKECNEKCQSECKKEGSGDTVCEMKCDTKCGANAVKDKFNSLIS